MNGGGILDLNASGVEQHKRLIELAEKKVASYAAGSAEATKRAEAAKERLEQI